MIPFPNKKYSIIYADPPWDGLGWNKNNSGLHCPANHYSVMSDSEIFDLPIYKIREENCALFLWVTFPNLPLGLEVINRWGFRYATQAFTWIKKNRNGYGNYLGLGNYTRANAELCLLGIRGSMIAIDKTVPSVIEYPLTIHSRKPPVVRDRIVKLFGELPRIELFARESFDGWDYWGNEVTEYIPDESLGFFNELDAT